MLQNFRMQPTSLYCIKLAEMDGIQKQCGQKLEDTIILLHWLEIEEYRFLELIQLNTGKILSILIIKK